MTSPLTLAYQLRIHLVDSEPEIWRRILVPVDMNLDALHHAIQSAFEWQGYHLFSFWKKQKHGRRSPSIYPTNEEWDFFDHSQSEAASKKRKPQRLPLMSDVLSVGEKLMYTYDFGDDWEHEILCEALLIKPLRIRLPYCNEGGQNAALEDSGGIYAYQEMMYALQNRGDPEYEEYAQEILNTWGENIAQRDPNAFDAKKIKFRR